MMGAKSKEKERAGLIGVTDIAKLYNIPYSRLVARVEIGFNDMPKPIKDYITKSNKHVRLWKQDDIEPWIKRTDFLVRQRVVDNVSLSNIQNVKLLAQIKPTHRRKVIKSDKGYQRKKIELKERQSDYRYKYDLYAKDDVVYNVFL